MFSLFANLIVCLYGSLVFTDPLVDWDFSVSRNISDYVLPFNDTTLLEPRHKCHEKLFILIVVCSGVNNFVARYVFTVLIITKELPNENIQMNT